MKVCWRNNGTSRSTIMDFDDHLHEIFNQQRRAQALIHGIIQVGGSRVATDETYDSIEIWATYPFICTFTVFLLTEGEKGARPVVKVEFEVRENMGFGPGYATKVQNLKTGRILEDKVEVGQLAWEVVSWVAIFLVTEVPGSYETFRKLYGEDRSKLPGELDPEFWTINSRYPQLIQLDLVV